MIPQARKTQESALFQYIFIPTQHRLMRQQVQHQVYWIWERGPWSNKSTRRLETRACQRERERSINEGNNDRHFWKPTLFCRHNNIPVRNRLMLNFQNVNEKKTEPDILAKYTIA